MGILNGAFFVGITEQFYYALTTYSLLNLFISIRVT